VLLAATMSFGLPEQICMLFMPPMLAARPEEHHPRVTDPVSVVAGSPGA
jgi:hypothetical protein